MRLIVRPSGLFAGLVLVSALIVMLVAYSSLLTSGGGVAQAGPSVTSVEVDVVTTGNDDGTVGTVQTCIAVENLADGNDNDGDGIIDEVDTVTFDLVVKGIDPAFQRLAGYQWDVDYDGTLLSATSAISADAGGSAAPDDITMVSRIASTGGLGFLVSTNLAGNANSLTVAVNDATNAAPAGAFPAMHEPPLPGNGFDDDGVNGTDDAGEESQDGVIARVTMSVSGLSGITTLLIPSVIGGPDACG